MGRLKHERVRVTRNPSYHQHSSTEESTAEIEKSGESSNVLLERAMVIMRVHADRKSMLEVANCNVHSQNIK